MRRRLSWPQAATGIPLVANVSVQASRPPRISGFASSNYSATGYPVTHRTLTRADMAKAVSRAFQTKPNTGAAVSEERRRLWNMLNQVITERGGLVVSKQYENPVRIECDPESLLPDFLSKAGWDLIYRAQERRVGGNNGFRNVVVYLLRLPK